mgnify:FL=1
MPLQRIIEFHSMYRLWLFLSRKNGFLFLPSKRARGESPWLFSKETLIKSLFDFTLVFSCNARNNPTRIASYLRRVMTKRCMKIHVKSNSAIESAFP